MEGATGKLIFWHCQKQKIDTWTEKYRLITYETHRHLMIDFQGSLENISKVRSRGILAVNALRLQKVLTAYAPIGA
ncbi:hypothetical protein YC2023_096363 [Brassica napus]